jgi:hypothetical protein
LRGPYRVRALKAHWRTARKSKVRSRYLAVRSRATTAPSAPSGLELIDLVMQKAQQLKHELGGAISPDRQAAVLQTLAEIIASPSRPVRHHKKAIVEENAPVEERAPVAEKVLVAETALVAEKVPVEEKAAVAERAPIEEKALVAERAAVAERVPAADKATVEEKAPVEPERVAPARPPKRNGGRSPIASANLESAITEAIRKRAPGCESLVGVIVQPTTPKSRFDANWAVRGVKFGKADRAKVNEAIVAVVESMQREFQLTDE